MSSNVDQATEAGSALPLLSTKSEHDDSDWILCAEDHDVSYVGDSSIKDKITWRNLRRVLVRACSWDAWRHRFPILLWLPKYSWQYLKGDVIAGITVGMTCIPQALAYAQIAGLPLEVCRRDLIS